MIFNYTQQYWLTSSITGELVYDINGYPSMSGEETSLSFTPPTLSKYEAIKPVAAVNVGTGTSTIGAFSVAQGKDSVSTGAYSYALGDKVVSKGTGSISVGKESVTSGSYSLAVGQNVTTKGDSSLASGKGTIASGSNSLAAGSGSKAEGVNSVAFGKGTIAKTDEQVVIGKYNAEDTQSLFVVGAGTNDANRKTIMKVDTVGARIDGSMTISGSSTFTNIGPAVFSGSIVQAENTATGINALGFGLYNTAAGDYSVTHGKNNNAAGYGAVVSGEGNLAIGDHVLVHGYASKATADYAFASGYNVSASGQYQHVIGKYNIPSTTQYAFIIGNGSSNANRSNLLVASGNTIQITGSLYVSKSIDSNNRLLYSATDVYPSIDWSYRYLINQYGDEVVYWNTGQLLTPDTSVSINWISRSLQDNNQQTVLNWSGSKQLIISASNLYAKGLTTGSTSNVLTYNPTTGQVYYTASAALTVTSASFASTSSFVNILNQTVTVSGSLNISGSILPSDRKLYYSDGTVSVDWNASETYDNHGNSKSIEWDNRILRDTSGATASIDWGGRRLHDSNNTRRLLWNTAGVQVSGSLNVTGSILATAVSASFTGSLTGHVTSSAIDTVQYKLKVNNVQKVDWDLGILGFAETQSIDWANRRLIEGGDISVDWGLRKLNDANSAIPSIDWDARRLYDIGGSEVAGYDIANRFYVNGNVTTKLAGNSWAGLLNDTQSFYSGEIHNNYSLNDDYEAGYLLYLDYATETWVPIDQTTDSCINFLGINTQGKGAQPTVVTDGFVRMTDVNNPQAGVDIYILEPTLGRPVYIIEGSNGDPTYSFSCVIPASGYVRVVGHVVARGSVVTDNYMIKFRPSNDWYEI